MVIFGVVISKQWININSWELFFKKVYFCHAQLIADERVQTKAPQSKAPILYSRKHPNTKRLAYFWADFNASN